MSASSNFLPEINIFFRGDNYEKFCNNIHPYWDGGDPWVTDNLNDREEGNMRIPSDGHIFTILSVKKAFYHKTADGGDCNVETFYKYRFVIINCNSYIYV